MARILLGEGISFVEVVSFFDWLQVEMLAFSREKSVLTELKIMLLPRLFKGIVCNTCLCYIFQYTK